jgi:hypothetical protein
MLRQQLELTGVVTHNRLDHGNQTLMPIVHNGSGLFDARSHLTILVAEPTIQ